MRPFRFLALLALPLVLAAGAAPTSPVVDAAMRGDFTQVKSLLAAGRDVNAPQGDGMTALHWAADRGDLPMVDLLLKSKASVRATTRMAGYTPLHIAAKGGHGAIVIALLKAGADPNAMTETGALPLHFAAASGALDGVAALLDKGADPNAREKVYGQTPLIFAASADRAAVITTLIKRGKFWPGPTRYHECSTATELVADDFHLFGPAVTLATACSSSALAIATAAEMIVAGDADVMLAGGGDSISRMTWGGFHSLLLVDQAGCRQIGRAHV